MEQFDFKGLALLFAGLSLGLIGVAMAAGAFFPEVAEQYKRQITSVIVGVILVAVASAIVSAMGG